MNSQSGLSSSARAIARRCCSPPDRRCDQISSRSSWSARKPIGHRRARCGFPCPYRYRARPDRRRQRAACRSGYRASAAPPSPRRRQARGCGPRRTARCRRSRGTASICRSPKARPRARSRRPRRTGLRLRRCAGRPVARYRAARRDRELARWCRHAHRAGGRHRLGALDRCPKGGQAIDHRLEGGKRAIIVDEEIERALDPGERAGGLGSGRRRDRAREVERRGDNVGNVGRIWP